MSAQTTAELVTVRSMLRTPHRLVSFGIGTLATGALALSLAGCGSEQEVGSSATSEPLALSSSAPVVGGPRPQSPATTSSAESVSSSAAEAGHVCRKIPGPDGALRVIIVAGNVSCATATEVANEYGPKIATGSQQQVSGWTCGPSDIEGMLAACVKGSDVIGFTP